MSKSVEYPKMLYRKAADGHEVHGVKCALKIVESEGDEVQARDEGYESTPAEAEAAAKKEQLAKARAAKKPSKPKAPKKPAPAKPDQPES